MQLKVIRRLQAVSNGTFPSCQTSADGPFAIAAYIGTYRIMQCHVQLEKSRREMETVRSENTQLKQFVTEVSLENYYSDSTLTHCVVCVCLERWTELELCIRLQTWPTERSILKGEVMSPAPLHDRLV